MRFGGTLSLACFIYSLASGLLGGLSFVPLLQQALGVLLVFFVFGRLVGEIGEVVASEDIAGTAATLEKEIQKIERETEIVCGVRKQQEEGRYVSIQDVRPGHVLASEVRDVTNQIVLPADHTLSEDDVVGMIGQGVRRVKIIPQRTTA